MSPETSLLVAAFCFGATVATLICWAVTNACWPRIRESPEGPAAWRCDTCGHRGWNPGSATDEERTP